jgi:hypothetical protein
MSSPAEAARRKAEEIEDAIATQEAIAERDAANPVQAGITSREAIPGRDDLEIASGAGYGGCTFAMLAPPAPAPAPVAQETHAEIEVEAEENTATQTVGPAGRPVGE